MKITVSILAWNNLDCTKILLNSLFEEIERLKTHDIIVNIFNNGSDDGTDKYLETLEGINIFSSKTNIGISRAKNKLIEESLGSEYMFMFDNDVCIRSGTLNLMIEFMENNKNVGCFGQNIDNYTKDLNNEIIKKEVNKTNFILYNVKSGCGAIRAWTHYSIYRTKLFQEGVRFCEEGPFSKAGYGFDDDDLGMQIFKKGYRIACFNDVIIYHNINSSVKNLSNSSGLNFEEREKWFKNKWKL